MADIFLYCAADTALSEWGARDFERMLEYAQLDKVRRHSLVEHPEVADIVVFVGSTRANYSDIRQSDLYRQYRAKSVIFVSGDRTIATMPGLYCCLEKRFSAMPVAFAEAASYLRVTDNNALDNERDIESAKYLFSFLGNAGNHPVRARLCRLSHSRALLQDSRHLSSSQSDELRTSGSESGVNQASYYRNLLFDSVFVLCPRGIGVSSWRLFETMRAGRVPVIISDHWVAPKGPQWERFSVLVKEKDIAGLPELLEQLEPRATNMSRLARQQWLEWFAEDVIFDTSVSALLRCHENRQDVTLLDRLLIRLEYLRPFYIRHWLIGPLSRAAANLILLSGKK